ncbi:hypothetical protein [Pseudomonas shirazensis]
MYHYKKYKDRHRILETLQNKYNQNYSPDIISNKELSLSFYELVNQSKLTENEIIEQLDFLSQESEINVVEEENFNFYYIIKRNGSASYYDKKYLNIRKNEFKNDTYDFLKIISTLILLLLIAIITFCINIIDTRKNKKEIEELKKEIQQIKILKKN